MKKQETRLKRDDEQQMIEQFSSLLRKLDDKEYRVIGNCVYKEGEFWCLTSNQDEILDIHYFLLWTEENRIEELFRKHAKHLFTEKQYILLDYLFGLGEVKTEDVSAFLEVPPRCLGAMIGSINKKSEKTLIDIKKKLVELDIRALEDFIRYCIHPCEEEGNKPKKPNRNDSWNALTSLFKTKGLRK